MLARWRPCLTTSGELYRRYCANKKENAGRVANYLRTMGTIWRPLSRPKVMMMGQIAYLDAYGAGPGPAATGGHRRRPPHSPPYSHAGGGRETAAWRCSTPHSSARGDTA